VKKRKPLLFTGSFAKVLIQLNAYLLYL